MTNTLTLTGTEATATFEENALQTMAELLFADATFTVTPLPDTNVGFDGGMLTLTGLDASDIVSVNDAGTSTGQIGLSGASVSYEGTVIGALTGGNGDDLAIAFNASATPAGIEALVESLTFQSTSDTPTAVRALTLDISDAGGSTLSAAPSIEVTVTAQDDPLTISGLPTALTGDEDAEITLDMSTFSMSDPDATAPITVTLTAGTGTISITDAAKDAAVAAAQAAADSAAAAEAAAQAALDAAQAELDTAAAATAAAEAIQQDAQEEASDAFSAYQMALIEFDLGQITQQQLDDAFALRVSTQNTLDAATADTNAAASAEAVAQTARDAAATALTTAAAATADANAAVTDAQAALPQVDDNGTSEVTITGLPDDINALLTATDAVAYTGATDAFGDDVDSITMTTSETEEPVGTIAVSLADVIDDRTATQAGDEGRDRFVGTDGADRMFGNGGNDEIAGGLGNDLLDGGAGADSMQGGMGNDAYIVDDAGDVVREVDTFSNGGGVDTVFSSIDYMLTDNTEILRLTGDATTGTGNDAVNVLVGNALDNVLNGGGGDDRLVGNDGNDVLTGNSGADVLVGGFGVDTFVFTSIADSRAGAGNRDLINGFVHRAEQIDLSAIDANTYNGAATNDAWTFIGTRAFDGTWGDSAGQLRTQGLGDDVNAILVEGDHNGDGVADFQILINGTHWMTGTDFVL